jgi:hypothetical protein
MASHPWVRRAVVIAALVNGVWAAWLLGGGGATLHTPCGPLRSHSPNRPLVVSVVLSLWYYVRCRVCWEADAGRLASLDWPRTIALASAVATFGLGVVWGNPLATGADASGYVSQAELWTSGGPSMNVPVIDRAAGSDASQPAGASC